MKCPNCQAELLPVDGVLFCLQCGRAIAAGKSDKSSPTIENTTDPLLQKAITDSLGHQVKWKLPVAAAPPQPVKSFASLHHAMSTTRPMTPAAAGGPQVAPMAAASLPVAMPAAPEVEAPKHGVGSLNLLPRRIRPKQAHLRQFSLPSLGWTVGALVAGLFIAGNLGIYGYYNDRVYPGVKVGQVAVGGIKQSDLTSYLEQHEVGSSDLTLEVGGSKYVLAGKSLGSLDVARASREAMDKGHDVELPLAGMITALLSKPVVMQRQFNDAAVHDAATKLAGEVDHPAREPVPMIVGSQAFVIAEKNGEEISVDKAAGAISDALLAGKTQANVPRQNRTPVLTANAYQDDLSAAQTRLGLALRLTVGTSTYSPSSAQIGSWLSFAGAGKGVVVNQTALAAYVAGLPGNFDRSGLFTVLLAAVGSGQGLAYTASTVKVTETPKPAGSPPSWPVATYSYCVAAPSGSTGEVRSIAATALADPAGWGLGGRVKFVPVDSGCNFSVALVSGGAMELLDQRCARQSTCQVGDQLELNLTNWQQPPSAWTAGMAAYRTELVSHEVGHWLGFDHASCLGKSQATSVLQAPSLVLDGCSPNWFALTADQSNKVLQGF